MIKFHSYHCILYNYIIMLLCYYNGQFSNNSINPYFRIIFITLIFATQYKNTLKIIP